MSLRILTIDPSLTCTGYAVFERRKGEWALVTQGAVETVKEAKKRGIYAGDDMVRRIKHIYVELRAVIKKWGPTVILAELTPEGAKSKNAAAALAISKAVVVGLGALLDIPVYHCMPDQVKKAFTGDAGAGKDAMMKEADRRYEFEQYRSKTRKSGYADEFEDIADAVAVLEVFREAEVIKMLENMAGKAGGGG